MPRKDQIEQMAEDDGPITRQDVSESLDLSEAYAGTLLAELARQTPPRLVRVEQGLYEHPSNVNVPEAVSDLREGAGRASGSGKGEDDSGGERQFSVVPKLEVGAGQEMLVVSEELELPASWVRSTYSVSPDRICLMEVRGDSMLDTLRPGQRLIAARQKGDPLQDGLIYGLRSPLGFQVKRLRFDRRNEERGIWIWSDNDDYADQRRFFPLEAFEEEYDIIARALEVSQSL